MLSFVLCVANGMQTLKDGCDNELKEDYVFTHSFQTQWSVSFLSASCYQNCVEPLSVTISFSPPVIDFAKDKVVVNGGTIISVVSVNTAEVVGGRLGEESEDPSETQSFVLFLSPKSSDSSSIEVSVPSRSFHNRYGLQNLESNTVRISLGTRTNNGQILTRSSINQNPFDVMVSFDSPVTSVPSSDQLDCENCRVISISLDRPDLLRVILQVDAEGYGSLHLPNAISLNENGVASEALLYSFYYGSSGDSISCRCHVATSDSLLLRNGHQQILHFMLDADYGADRGFDSIYLQRFSVYRYHGLCQGRYGGEALFIPSGWEPRWDSASLCERGSVSGFLWELEYSKQRPDFGKG